MSAANPNAAAEQAAALERSRAMARDYASKDAMNEWKQNMDPNNSRSKHNLLPKHFQAVDEEHEAKINAYIDSHRTWRASVPGLATTEYWQLRADYYPYIKRSDEKDDFFLRGVTVHPRLSDYPMCKTVIRDYFVCRDANPVMQLFNTCKPLKEQFCSCINEVFVRNHERGDAKFNAEREGYFAAQRERRFEKMVRQVEETKEVKTKLQD
ncbi:hypothetical protein STCU_06080 [Strigomonas culicis]|uniref:Uncharacterized protein n=1 Tax=Strigomonas culicis TaxID=28005 RepID=S9VU55_9TRYP|nr:hypothetical protein STCU_06995 [Strigomonas culicis]EPY26785.1 hypothetical protein STCU_06080 [Strigomonas culicis]|eukprot:EPY24806.1 hypothetical protein STCU_06995 [Strigomonas culicis]